VWFVSFVTSKHNEEEEEEEKQRKDRTFFGLGLGRLRRKSVLRLSFVIFHCLALWNLKYCALKGLPLVLITISNKGSDFDTNKPKGSNFIMLKGPHMSC